MNCSYSVGCKVASSYLWGNEGLQREGVGELEKFPGVGAYSKVLSHGSVC
jgi:hypothetical protein